MEDNLYKILKELREIKPDARYSEHSRFLILSSEKKAGGGKISIFHIAAHLHFFGRATAAIGILAIFVSSVYLIVSYLPGGKNDLVAEANEINASIQIELNEIKYNLENSAPVSPLVAADVYKKLEEAAKQLEKAKALSAGEEISNEISDEILDNIKAGQKALIEIKDLLKP